MAHRIARHTPPPVRDPFVVFAMTAQVFSMHGVKAGKQRLSEFCDEVARIAARRNAGERVPEGIGAILEIAEEIARYGVNVSRCTRLEDALDRYREGRKPRYYWQEGQFA